VKSRFIHLGETIASVFAEEARFLDLAEEEIRRQRRFLVSHILQQPSFKTALDPLDVPDDAPAIVRRMAAAAARAGVGPMAAVAGALAGCAVRAMAEAGARYAVVDNGGDIAFLIDRPVTVGIFTGPARIRDIAFRIEPRPDLFSVCTSSGTVGHSLSFGRADAAVVVAADACLADAAATALGNGVPGDDPAPIESAVRRVLAMGVEGCLVVADEVLVCGGELPPLVRVPIGGDHRHQNKEFRTHV
jgi:ApbE superfamily uncharacterized protein (UPF0280 family)